MLVQLGTARSSRRSTLRFADRRRSFLAFREKNEKIPMRQAPFLGPVPPWVNALSAPEPTRERGTARVGRRTRGRASRWAGQDSARRNSPDSHAAGLTEQHEWESERSYPDRGDSLLIDRLERTRT